jgi:predicted nucleic acid-binding protein
VLAIVDTGPLFAVLDRGDRDHERCVAELRRPDLELLIPALVVAEVCYLADARLGPAPAAGFLRGLAALHVESPLADEWIRIAELVEQYADFPLGGVDASVVALAERVGATRIVTLDRRHFSVVRPRHCERFELLPG